MTKQKPIRCSLKRHCPSKVVHGILRESLEDCSLIREARICSYPCVLGLFRFTDLSTLVGCLQYGSCLVLMWRFWLTIITKDVIALCHHDQ